MEMTNVTEIRKNIRSILLNVARSKKPVAILQRSKPVAYIVDADTFESLTGSEDQERKALMKSREESLDRIAILKNRISNRTKTQGDSTLLIRELRERHDA